MKKPVSLLLLAALLLSLAASVSAEGMIIGAPGTMYVYTSNGKSLNVRSEPRTGDNVIGHVGYGKTVEVVSFQGSWAEIAYGAAGHPTAWVQSRFLQWYAPGPKPTPKPEEEDPEAKKTKAELQSEAQIEPLHLQAQATRVSGWVNMRKSPSKETKRIQTCADGTELIAFAETTNWYHVTDPATGNSGYVHKNYVKVIPAVEPVVDQETQIGTLKVNGEFMLRGKIPDGYKLQVISARDTQVIATLVADDGQSPQMMLTIAFSEMYEGIERMNDMSDEEITTLKETFTDMNEVEITEAETAAGTKLLVARETGRDEDFISIVSVYMGYSVEFVISPNPDAADQALTDAHLRTAVDFLSNLDFIPAD